MLNRDWPWYQEKMEVGRAVVTAKHPEDFSQPEFLDAWLYYKDQAAQVSQMGSCEGHCQLAELIECNGHSLCRRTMNPCPRHHLSQIVSLFEEAFSNVNSGSDSQ